MSDTQYSYVDFGDGLIPIEDDDEDLETTEVTKLMEQFRAEVDRAHEAGETALHKVRRAARVARRRGSVDKLKAHASQPPPPKEKA